MQCLMDAVPAQKEGLIAFLPLLITLFPELLTIDWRASLAPYLAAISVIVCAIRAHQLTWGQVLLSECPLHQSLFTPLACQGLWMSSVQFPGLAHPQAGRGLCEACTGGSVSVCVCLPVKPVLSAPPSPPHCSSGPLPPCLNLCSSL